MEKSNGQAVEIVEVGPRDGFQPIGPFIPTETKVRFLERLVAAGVRRVEIGSFVSAKAVPQLRDTAEVLTAAARLPSLAAQVLVPSERRGREAVAAGAKHLVFVLSVTEAHNRNNVQRHPLESVAEYERLLAAIPPDVAMRLDVATSFDCPFTGRVPEEAVLALLDRLVPLRPDAEVCLCDTTGTRRPRACGEPGRGVPGAFPRSRGLGAAPARHLWARARQRPRRLPGGYPRVRRLVRRAGRLPVRARGHRQCRDRGRGLDVRAHGGRDRDRPRGAGRRGSRGRGLARRAAGRPRA